MNKYIVKNCPAGQIVTSAVNPDMAGVYCKKEHKPCQDCEKCTLKDIANYCKTQIEFNKQYGLKKTKEIAAVTILQMLNAEEA